jgi:hypothetical protein
LDNGNNTDGQLGQGNNTRLLIPTKLEFKNSEFQDSPSQKEKRLGVF